VAPPHTVQNVKRSIANVEDIKDYSITTLFLTPYSQSPLGDAEEFNIVNRTGPGSMPQEPLALVANMSVSEGSTPSRKFTLPFKFGPQGAASTDSDPYRTSIQRSPTRRYRVLAYGHTRHLRNIRSSNSTL
jgi:hypothetical protein